ncbi:MAG: dienelactone hydrolase family protein [Vicinamibacterales bacterium]
MKRLLLPLVGLCLAVATASGGQRTPARDFASEYARLKAGKTYTAQGPGIHRLDTFVNGTLLDNTLDVPEGYDPAKPWPLRVQLHGGVGRMPPEPGQATRNTLDPNRIPGAPQLVLQPRAWATSQWWQRTQVDNIANLVERVKREYNVDESHIYLTGISDGGTGAYYLAMREATRWASCLPLNGHPSVLGNPDTGADGSLFIGNLVNCPLYLVNGGRDRLYPAASVAPFVDVMKRAGVDLLFNVYPEAGHDTSWWRVERAKFEAFVAAHPRQAHPARISWETERVDRYNRFRWLVIDRLGARPSDAALDDINEVVVGGRAYQLFVRKGRSGRVDITRDGNRFEARSRGVERFTLLLSPDVIDFSAPVTVTVNGRTAFEGTVREDVATLLEWAARDNDRTMLYGAEITINVP